MTVFKWPYRKMYYVTHPWKWITTLISNLRCAWQRVTKGYSDYDVYEMYDFILHLIPNMLADMATSEIGAYPGTEEFDTFEKWQDYLMGIAGEFTTLQDDWPESQERNEYAAKWLEELRQKHPIDKELRDKYFGRCKELMEEQNAATRKAFAHLAEHFYGLWI